MKSKLDILLEKVNKTMTSLGYENGSIVKEKNKVYYKTDKVTTGANLF